ncbi:hypothetical protein GORBP_082_00040 [Gordonia rubripertincta NBRC 101908]|uniref:Uncharacterized protein n=1 Tax=Gordonia rubripertincta NBRC 101908 TaxID=1077975 RepID=A0ABQ0HX40_GORRU|nr:hypothetical protein GORBP_082_00040 [Gordonia rubripertincta NBRC 101908]
MSSHDASDISCGEAEAGELLNGCISTSQAGTYRTQCLPETPDWMGDVLPPEADVDEDQSVVELDGKYVGDAFGNAHRCEGAAVEVVDMTNRSDLWKHDRNPSFRKLTQTTPQYSNPLSAGVRVCAERGKVRGVDQFSERGGGQVPRSDLFEVAAKDRDARDLGFKVRTKRGHRGADEAHDGTGALE